MKLEFQRKFQNNTAVFFMKCFKVISHSITLPNIDLGKFKFILNVLNNTVFYFISSLKFISCSISL